MRGCRRFLKAAAAAVASGARDVAAQDSRIVPDGAGHKVAIPRRVERNARILYPQAFPEDLRPIVRDFFTRCHHEAPSKARPDQLLRTAGAA